MKHSIGIIEDNQKIRTLIQKYLGNDDSLICEAAFESVELFLDYLKDHSCPDVLLMDIDLPGMSGIDGMKLIKTKHPETEIIMLTVYHDSHKIFNSLLSGATGYLIKNTPLPEIKASIFDVLQGGAAMSPQIARKVIHHFSSKQAPKPEKSPDQEELTPREHEIVIGLVDGLSYKLIADRMSISLDTVRAHIRNIYRKLHVNSKAEVIAKSLKGEIR